MKKTGNGLVAALVFAGFVGTVAAASSPASALNIKEAIWARLDAAGKLVACDGKFRRGEKVQSSLSLPAGAYTMQVTVRDLIGKTDVTVKKPFALK